MYELIKLSKHDYYIDGSSKIGLIVDDNKNLTVIDTGTGVDTSSKIIEYANENGWKITTVVNTHSHSDHIGGNAYLQEQTGCNILVPGISNSLTVYPILDPITLFGGFPLKDYSSKFFLAKPSNAKMLTEDNIPKNLTAVDLSGHTMEMVGFMTADNNFFAADTVLSEKILNKHKISYLYDIAGHLRSIEKLKSIKANKYIPSHAEVTDNILPLADKNIAVTNEVADTILNLCKKPATFDSVMKSACDIFDIHLNAVQYALIGSTVRSYLSYLYNKDCLEISYENNQMTWHKK